MFDILYGEGISKEGSILDLAVEKKLISKSGSWYTYGDIRIGQGRENARQFLKDNPEAAQKLEEELRAMGPSDAADKPGAAAADDEIPLPEE